MGRCHACGVEIQSTGKILRTEECASCGWDLHVCRNCRHYNPAVHNQCEEPMAEWVSDRERANFCDYFSFTKAPGPNPANPGRSPEEEARERWDRLYKS